VIQKEEILQLNADSEFPDLAARTNRIKAGSLLSLYVFDLVIHDDEQWDLFKEVVKAAGAKGWLIIVGHNKRTWETERLVVKNVMIKGEVVTADYLRSEMCSETEVMVSTDNCVLAVWNLSRIMIGCCSYLSFFTQPRITEFREVVSQKNDVEREPVNPDRSDEESDPHDRLVAQDSIAGEVENRVNAGEELPPPQETWDTITFKTKPLNWTTVGTDGVCSTCHSSHWFESITKQLSSPFIFWSLSRLPSPKCSVQSVCIFTMQQRRHVLVLNAMSWPVPTKSLQSRRPSLPQ